MGRHDVYWTGDSRVLAMSHLVHRYREGMSLPTLMTPKSRACSRCIRRCSDAEVSQFRWSSPTLIHIMSTTLAKDPLCFRMDLPGQDDITVSCTLSLTHSQLSPPTWTIKPVRKACHVLWTTNSPNTNHTKLIPNQRNTIEVACSCCYNRSLKLGCRNMAYLPRQHMPVAVTNSGPVSVAAQGGDPTIRYRRHEIP